MKTQILRLVACLPLLLSPAVCHGLALSKLELKSYLNQSLDARVRLLSASREDLNSLKVTVTVDHADAGSSGVQLEYKVEEDEQGPYIHITSPDAVREPIMTLILDVSWGGGRMTREYPLIVDPR